MRLQGSTVAVTGATGFVGSHIALTLAARGARVIGVVRTPAKGAWMEAHGVELVRGDLTDRASLIAAFDGADAVVSNAALGSGQGELADFERVNCEGVGNVVDTAAAAGARRLVHISTVAVYRTRLWRRLAEDAEPYDTTRRRFNWSDLTTDWRYARTKALAERIAWERAGAHGLDLTCLRPGPVYGARDHKATAAALDNPASGGKAYNLAGEPVSQWRFLRTMKRTLGRGSWLLPLPLPVWVRYDTAAARRDLGFAPRTIDEGLAEALAEYRTDDAPGDDA